MKIPLPMPITCYTCMLSLYFLCMYATVCDTSLNTCISTCFGWCMIQAIPSPQFFAYRVVNMTRMTLASMTVPVSKHHGSCFQPSNFPPSEIRCVKERFAEVTVHERFSFFCSKENIPHYLLRHLARKIPGQCAKVLSLTACYWEKPSGGPKLQVLEMPGSLRQWSQQNLNCLSMFIQFSHPEKSNNYDIV